MERFVNYRKLKQLLQVVTFTFKALEEHFIGAHRLRMLGIFATPALSSNHGVRNEFVHLDLPLGSFLLNILDLKGTIGDTHFFHSIMI